MSENPFLSGNFAPVKDEVVATRLRVDGEIPVELNGRYLRNGPNPASEVNPARHHWFVGDGMVHGLRLEEGQPRWYRNRFVRTPAVSRALGEEPVPNPLGDYRVSVANTNVIGHAGRTFAIVEGGGCPVELSYELETLAFSDFERTLPRAFSAHPKRDPVTGELHTIAYYWGWGEQVQYVCVDPDAKVSRTIDIPTHGGPMIHDTAFTERYVIVMDLPCAFDKKAAQSGVSLPYRWQEDYPARLGLLPRAGGDVIWIDIDPCYIFHPLNAYDRDDGSVVFEAVRHPRMFAKNTLGPDEGRPSLDRWVLDPVGRRATHDVIDERAHEFPRHNEALEGRYSRYGYSTDQDMRKGQMPLLKTDLDTGAVTEHSRAGRHHLEGVFVPRAGATAEDDGWVMAYAWDAAENSACVVIVDGQDFSSDPVATIHLPQRVPFGFHGNWIAD